MLEIIHSLLCVFINGPRVGSMHFFILSTFFLAHNKDTFHLKIDLSMGSVSSETLPMFM